MKYRLLYVVNTPEFFISHRLPIAIAARDAGLEVHIATAAGKKNIQFDELKLEYHLIPLSRSGTNPIQEFQSVVAIYRLIRKLRPDIVHLVTIKPVLYGGMAARMAKVPGMIAAISGLGITFSSDNYNSGFIRKLIRWQYKLALNHINSKVIFQNPDDEKILIKSGSVKPDQCVIIPGSGVKLSDINVLPEPVGMPVIIFASRLLKDKGILELVSAARMLKDQGFHARFLVAGSPDPDNPASVSDTELNAWNQEGIIELLGYREDITDLFSSSNIVVLPSYYGEGLPKVLIEAAACGRAVITTDHPGCRDAIIPDVTGLLISPRNATALADAIKKLLKDVNLRKSMGKEGRKLAERRFSIDKIIDAHLQIYNEILEGAR